MYSKVLENEALEKAGEQPTSARWVGENKGDKREPQYRLRHAAMPPLEAKKALFSLPVSGRAWSGDVRKLIFTDAKQAYLHAPVGGEGKDVQPPEEDAAKGMCGTLNVSLCGTRNAARDWEEKYVKVLSDLGFVVGSCRRAWFGMRSVNCGRRFMEMTSPLSATARARPGSNRRWVRDLALRDWK